LKSADQLDVGPSQRETCAVPNSDDLMLLRQCDTAGRVPGVTVGTADEALA